MGGLETSVPLFGLGDNELSVRDEHLAGSGARYISGSRESPSGEVASRLEPEGALCHVVVSSQSDWCRQRPASVGACWR